jgi:hypothetical protein
MERVLLGVFLFVVAGCGNFPFGPQACDLEARPALRVNVTDARSGAPDSASVTARDADFVETVTLRRYGEATALEAQLAHERAGTYTVTVDAPGYNAYSRSGLRVRGGTCHVRTVELDAALTPSS